MDKTFFKQFGGSVTNELIQQYQQSENWKNGSFQNLEATDMNISLTKLPSVIYKQFLSRNRRSPKHPLLVQPFDKTAFLEKSPDTKIIWYGHSAILMRMNNKSILIDPMLGPDTTPIAPTASKRFSKNTLHLIDQFPDIDLILITHDHYDHLDYASIQKLKLKTKQYFVALGVKRHLVSWGVRPELITEVDWWQTNNLDNIKITYTPTRHFSGRGLTDRQKTLWGGWFFETGNEKIWFSGDGGYGNHFKEIRKRLGPIDFAFMECGQYNDDWHNIHLFPNEAVKAAIDAGAKKAMPVHWGGFDLSYQHSWKDPVNDFLQSAQKHQLDYSLPRLGEMFTIQDELKQKWWEELE